MDLLTFIKDNFDTISGIAVTAITAIIAYTGANYLHKDTAPDYKYGSEWIWIWLWSLICASAFIAGMSLVAIFTNKACWIACSLWLEPIANVIVLFVYCKAKVHISDVDKFAKANTVLISALSVIGAWTFMIAGFDALFTKRGEIFSHGSADWSDRIMVISIVFVIYEFLGAVAVLFLSRTDRVKKYSYVDITYTDETTETIEYDKRGQKGDNLIFERIIVEGEGNNSKRDFYRLEIKKSDVKKLYFYDNKDHTMFLPQQDSVVGADEELTLSEETEENRENDESE